MKGNHKEAAAAQKTAQQAKRQQHMRQREPMFCLELVIRLWCWAQYSYRRFWLDGGMDHGWLMGLFGFTGFGALLDPMSDTHLVLAWNDGTLLLAFRGTASKANAVTDVKVGRLWCWLAACSSCGVCCVGCLELLLFFSSSA